MFRPKVIQMNTAIKIQKREEVNINGAGKVSYIDAEPAFDFCLWKSKGGTETTHNQSGTLIVEDTVEVTMWYRPDINQKDRILLDGKTNAAYEVINAPENVEQRNMFLMFKVRRVVNA